MKKELLILYFLLLLQSSFAQSKRTDSLFAILSKHPQADTFRVNRLIDLTNEWGLTISQYDSVANEALALARKLDYKAGEAQALFTAGSILYVNNRNNPAKQAQVRQAQQLLEQAIQLAEQSGDQRILNRILTQFAASKRMSGTEKKQAIRYDQRALAIAVSLKDFRLIIHCQSMIALDYEYVDENYAAALHWNMKALQTARQARCRECELFPLRSIGTNYTSLKNYNEALRYLQTGLAISRQLKGTANNEFQYYLLSATGKLYRTLGRYPEAIQAYEQALAVRKLDYPTTTSTIFDNQLAAIYEAQGQYRLAIAHGVRGLAKARQDQNNWWEADISNSLSRAYLHTGKLDSARYYGHQSVKIARETHKKDLIRDAYATLAELYAHEKQYDKAYYFQGLYHTYRDSLNNEDITRKATAAQFTNQINQQQSQIKLLTKAKQLQTQVSQQDRFQRNAAIIGAIMLLLLAGAITAYLLNRARLRRLEEAQRLRQQIAQDLHDEVGSTLSSISLLSGHTDRLLSENRPETAQKMVQKIYTDARQILEAIDEIIWTINPGNDSLQRVIQRLREYAQPLMESKGIAFMLTTDSVIDQLPVSMDVRRNLYLIGKEAINNLVKYSDATQATVRFEHRKEQLLMRIEDNGRGFDTTQVTIRNGQQSMTRRAAAIGGSLAVSSAPELGTSLVVTASLAM